MMDTSPLERNQLDEQVEKRLASQHQQKVDDAGAAAPAGGGATMNTSSSGTGSSTSLVVDHAPSGGGGAVDANSMARSLFIFGGGKRHGAGESIDNTGTRFSNIPTTNGTTSISKKRKILGTAGSSSPMISGQQQQAYAPAPINPTLLRMGEDSSMSRRMPPQLQYNDGSGYGITGTASNSDTARAMQMNLLQQQQHALLASRLAQQQQEQQQSQQEAMTTQQQQQSQQLNSNFSPNSFDARLLSPQAGSNFFLGGHGAPGMNSSLLGVGGSAGLLLQNFRGMSGMGGDATGGDQSFMHQHQLGAFGGAGGLNLAGNNTNPGDHNNNSNKNDTSLASLGMTSASARQLILMQQALAGGIGGPSAGMLAQHQGQFLGGMQGFSMAENIHFAQQQGFVPSSSMVLPSSSSGGDSNHFRGPQATTGGERSGSSMTPAGISHQALYARDASEEDGSGGQKRSVLYMACDDDSLSAYQCLVRKQVQLFDANEDDVESNAQGRNRAIVMGQVGIRCRHCSKIPPRHRTRGATYYPAKLNGLYQAAQNMASAHLGKHCQLIPDRLRQELIILRDRKSSAGGGKQYWADGVRVLGVVETNDVLRFAGDGEKDDAEDEAETVVAHGDNEERVNRNATKEKDSAQEKSNGDEKKQVLTHDHVDKNQI